MPQLPVNGTRLHVLDTGAGVDFGDPVLFSHGLLWDHSLYAPQIEALRPRFRCVAYDHRGQGRSEVPRGLSSISQDLLTEDAAALIKVLNLGKVHFVGLSMGGFVGLRLAARYPQLVRSLTLMCTAADVEPPENLRRYRMLSLAARILGPSMLKRQVAPIMLGASLLNDPARSEVRTACEAVLAGNRRSIYKAVNGVLDREGVEELLPRIACPTLVILGGEDRAISEERSLAMAGAIPDSRVVHVQGGGHSLPRERPDEVTALMREFLGQL